MIEFCEDLKKQKFVYNKEVNCWLVDNFGPWLLNPSEEAIMRKAKNKSYELTESDLNGEGHRLPIKD